MGAALEEDKANMNDEASDSLKSHRIGQSLSEVTTRETHCVVSHRNANGKRLLWSK
jgi:hypothetical protein